MTHEETSIAGSHLGTHSNPLDLLVEIAIELEGVEGKNQFGKTDKSVRGRIRRRSLLEKKAKCLQTVTVRNVGVKCSYIHSANQRRKKGWVPVEGLKLIDCICGVLDERRESRNQRLKEGIKIGRDMLSGASTSRNNRATWRIGLMYLRQHVKDRLPRLANSEKVRSRWKVLVNLLFFDDSGNLIGVSFKSRGMDQLIVVLVGQLP